MSKKVKMEAINTVQSRGRLYLPGKTFEVLLDEARRLVAKGAAKPCQVEPAEAEAQTEPEENRKKGK